jgi:LysM repeat protein
MATQYAQIPGGARVPNGQRQIRPLRSVHTVKPGETLGMVASQYGTTPQALLSLNSHTVGGQGIIHQGMRLQV